MKYKNIWLNHEYKQYNLHIKIFDQFYHYFNDGGKLFIRGNFNRKLGTIEAIYLTWDTLSESETD